MTEEDLKELWRQLSSATNIDELAYDEAIVIGSVFGQMRREIREQREEIESLKQNQKLPFETFRMK